MRGRRMCTTTTRRGTPSQSRALRRRQRHHPIRRALDRKRRLDQRPEPNRRPSRSKAKDQRSHRNINLHTRPNRTSRKRTLPLPRPNNPPQRNGHLPALLRQPAPPRHPLPNPQPLRPRNLPRRLLLQPANRTPDSAHLQTPRPTPRRPPAPPPRIHPRRPARLPHERALLLPHLPKIHLRRLPRRETKHHSAHDGRPSPGELDAKRQLRLLQTPLLPRPAAAPLPREKPRLPTNFHPLLRALRRNTHRNRLSAESLLHFFPSLRARSAGEIVRVPDERGGV